MSWPGPWPLSRWLPAVPSSLRSSGGHSSALSRRAIHSPSRPPDFQPVGAWIAAQLGRPEYAHFLRPNNPGGGTQGGPPGTQGLPTTPAQTAPAAVPQNMSEAILMQMAAIQKSTIDPLRAGATIANADGSVSRQSAPGFGLRPYHPSKTA